jgi:hypothetical protein
MAIQKRRTASTAIVIALIVTAALVSCDSGYYTMEDFSSVPKVDAHFHINSESTAMVELAREDNFRLLTVNVDNGRRPLDTQYHFATYQAEHSPEVVEFISAFDLRHWDSLGWEKEAIARLDRSFSDGALGIKLWKSIGMVYKDSSGNFIMVDNPRFDPVIQYVIDHNKTVLGHLGEPKNCWLPLEEMTVNNDRNYFREHPEYHMYLHPEYPSYEDQINARDRFLERHPDMRFVAAHLASLEWDVDELAKRFDKFPNMAADMAARICHLQYQSQKDREKVRDFIIKYQDRLIYGTDGGMGPNDDPEEARRYTHEKWLEDWKYFVTDETMSVDEVSGEFQGLKLPKEVVDKIYYANAVRWFEISDY